MRDCNCIENGIFLSELANMKTEQVIQKARV